MKLRINIGPTETSYWMWCPGCADAVRITNLWDFDGNVEAPTFSPSILTHGGPTAARTTCHSFLRAGIWEFLSDCTHALAGKSVPMVDLPGWLANE